MRLEKQAGEKESGNCHVWRGNKKNANAKDASEIGQETRIRNAMLFDFRDKR